MNEAWSQCRLRALISDMVLFFRFSLLALIQKRIIFPCDWSIKFLMWIKLYRKVVSSIRRSILIKLAHRILLHKKETYSRVCYKFCIKFKYLLLNQLQSIPTHWQHDNSNHLTLYTIPLMPKYQQHHLNYHVALSRC